MTINHKLLLGAMRKAQSPGGKAYNTIGAVHYVLCAMLQAST
jgi:hypothetical protein